MLRADKQQERSTEPSTSTPTNPQLHLCETQLTHEPPESSFQERGQQERRTNLLPQVATPNQETPPSQASHRRGSEHRRSGDKAGGTYSTAAPLPPPPGNPTLDNLGPKLQPNLHRPAENRRSPSHPRPRGPPEATGINGLAGGSTGNSPLASLSCSRREEKKGEGRRPESV